jgi:phosphoglycolate phosphatase-like HAD superfamily hydrolase
MIRSAVADLNIDLKQSWFIGDTTTDAQTARNAGVKSILVRTGSAGKDGKHDARPDFTFDTLNEAVDFILSEKA